jgi:hypothetical protein
VHIIIQSRQLEPGFIYCWLSLSLIICFTYMSVFSHLSEFSRSGVRLPVLKTMGPGWRTQHLQHTTWINICMVLPHDVNDEDKDEE